MPIILHTKEEIHSQNNKLSSQEQLKQEFSLKRFKRSDNGEQLYDDDLNRWVSLSSSSFEQKYRKLYSNHNKPVYYDKKMKKYYYTEEFEKVYIEEKDVNYKKVTSLYLKVLSGIKYSIEKGDVDRLKNLSVLVASITKTEKKTLLQPIFNKENNPIKDTNLIILACKHNQPRILNYLLSQEGSNFPKNLSDNINKSTIKPTDIDGENHNAFYYAIRLGNVELLETLIDEWPGNYFASNPDKLDEVLSKAYEELKLKNVPLSGKIEVFVEDKLISLRFVSQKNSQDIGTSLSTVKERINLMLDNIKLLQDLSKANNIDEKFLFISRFIVKNIRLLKRKLGSTYDKLPWEEMEFFLVSFISSYIKPQEINFVSKVVLDKEKLLKYLELVHKQVNLSIFSI